MAPCSTDKAHQQWRFDGSLLKSNDGDDEWCLDWTYGNTPNVFPNVYVSRCDPSDPHQQWFYGGAGGEFLKTKRKSGDIGDWCLDWTIRDPNNAYMNDCERTSWSAHLYWYESSLCDLEQSWRLENLVFNLDAVVFGDDAQDVNLAEHRVSNAASTHPLKTSTTFTAEESETFSFELSEESKRTVEIALGVEVGVSAGTSVTVAPPFIPSLSATGTVETSASASAEVSSTTETGRTYNLGETSTKTQAVETQWEQTVPGCTIVDVKFLGTKQTASIPYKATMVSSKLKGCSTEVTGEWKGASISRTYLDTVEETNPALTGTCAPSSDGELNASPVEAISGKIAISAVAGVVCLCICCFCVYFLVVALIDGVKPFYHLEPVRADRYSVSKVGI